MKKPKGVFFMKHRVLLPHIDDHNVCTFLRLTLMLHLHRIN